MRRRDGLRPNADLPKQFVECEDRIIRHRRHIVGAGRDARPLPIVALALSGGGVRSATFSLGFLQALATHHVLRVVDYLSTVSGGGYIGAFLGRFYTRFVDRPTGAVDIIEARLGDVNSPEISWLRRSSEYVAAAAVGEAPVTTAIILRAFLTLHWVVGVLLVAVFGVVNLFRYTVLQWSLASLDRTFGNVTRLSVPVQLPAPEPWLFLLVVISVIGLVPLAIAFWLPSESPQQRFQRSRLLAFVVGSGAGFLLSLSHGAWLVAAGMFVAAMSVFVWMVIAWMRVTGRVPGAIDHVSGLAMIRALLSKWLAVAVSVVAYLFCVWMLDRMVRDVYESVSVGHFLTLLAAWFAVLLLPLRLLALWVFARGSAPGAKREIGWRLLTNPFLLPVLLGVPLLIGWNFVSHAMFQGGEDVASGLTWTLVAVFLTAIVGRGASGIALVNRSSIHSLYAARGSRVYLGASNPYRHATEAGADISIPQPEDDILFDQYRPDRAGGPVHIINVFVNQSLDRTSGRRTRGRQGQNMAIGPSGISVGSASHAIWVRPQGDGETQAKLTPVDAGDLPHPFVPRRNSEDESKKATLRTTAMRLSEWMAISGATLAPGTHADTRLATSLLCSLVNVRAGFWWDSGIEDGDRAGEPLPSVTQKIWRSFMRCFRAQRLLLAEITGRFAGPWQRYWYLSDGGHGDDLGVYELVRRRIPIIVCVDATLDADGGLAALANAIRKVRVDFDATIEFLSASALDDLATTLRAKRRPIPQSVIDAVGTLDDIRCTSKSDSRKHAAIARVRYHDASQHSALLYVKATMTGDEPMDVIDYRRHNHRFPHESLLKQFLDEPQWESYRELGLHCASPLFSNGVQWLADVLNTLQENQTSTPRVQKADQWRHH